MSDKTIFFYRNYQGFSGGHLKVWDYFNHVRSSQNYTPHIFFDPGSLDDQKNPWKDEPSVFLKQWRPEEADVLFLGGTDWRSLPENSRKNWPIPVINLIQGIRHADPDSGLFEFLSNRAIRICVSPAVAGAIVKTGKVNGPVFTVPNGLDLTLFREPLVPWQRRTIDILIVSVKNRVTGRELLSKLNFPGLTVKLLEHQIPRSEFIQLMCDSRITLFLPEKQEGFYLPALEGMASGTLVVCPDCIGNRSFCRDGINCLMPEYSMKSILGKMNDIWNLVNAEPESILQNARNTALKHSLQTEREAFLKILSRMEALWIK